MSIRIEQFDGGEALYIALDPDGIWAKSEFPDELITLDYNAQGGLIGIEAIGSAARVSAGALLDALLQYEGIVERAAIREKVAPALT